MAQAVFRLACSSTTTQHNAALVVRGNSTYRMNKLLMTTLEHLHPCSEPRSPRYLNLDYRKQQRWLERNLE